MGRKARAWAVRWQYLLTEVTSRGHIGACHDPSRSSGRTFAYARPPANCEACAISGPRKRRPIVSKRSGEPVVRNE